MRDLYILLYDIELSALLMHHVSDISKQLIEFADALFDIADFGFAFDDEGFLEVDFVLVGESELELVLLLLLLEVGLVGGGGGGGVEGGAGGLCRCFFLVERGLLELLEFGQGGFEFALEFGLGEFLRGPDVRPCGDLLDTLANLLEFLRRLLDGGLDALADTGGLVLGADLGDFG